MKRRRLLASAALGGALVVGWGFLPPRSRLGGRETLGNDGAAIGLNGWIRITPEGGVQLAMPKAEMGQGVHTALAMLVAEELELPLERVQPVDAGADTLYGNVPASVESLLFFEPVDSEPGHETRLVRGTRWLLAKVVRELGVVVTGGSSSVADLWPVLPLAAATARAQLLGAASLRWKLPMAELQLADGVISHPSGPKAHFGELARAAAATPAAEVRIKPRGEWKRIGRPAPRTDLPAKVNGSAVFGIDVRQPGQLFAVVRMSPALHGAPGTAAVDAVLQRPGVLRVVRVPPLAGAPAALAVVGRSTWHAMEGARALEVDWLPAPGRAPDSKDIAKALAEAARAARDEGEGFAFRRRGDAASVRGARRLEAAYRAPYLAHATMEPMNCTARVAGGRVTLWVPTQVPAFARAAAAHVAGVPESSVDLRLTYLGGGFGRRLEVDVVAQAVRVALETGGRPVQLLWPREEDFAHDYYRPAAAAALRAELDEKGALLALTVGSAGDAIMPRWTERVFPLLAGPLDPPDRTTAEGLFDLPYAVPHLQVRHVATKSGVPVGSWRSVGHSHNAFFGECFADELAEAAGADPVAWRFEHLQHLPRHAAVLRRVAEAAGWGRPLPSGRARGVALHESFNAIVGMVVEASLAEGGRPQVHRIVCAADCGTVVHPAGVHQQLESAALFGLAAALGQRIDIVEGVVQQRNFDAWPLVTLARTPVIETHLVDSDRPPGGAGEPGTPPVAPALANALYALTGRRLRELPLVV
ncbi:MAG: molybdopterin cofactor-binding domain-containing protein [Rubrivivax sp.]